MFVYEFCSIGIMVLILNKNKTNRSFRLEKMFQYSRYANLILAYHTLTEIFQINLVIFDVFFVIKSVTIQWFPSLYGLYGKFTTYSGL